MPHVRVRGGMDPTQKIRIVAALQANGEFVAMGEGGALSDNICKFIRDAMTGNRAARCWCVRRRGGREGLAAPRRPGHARGHWRGMSPSPGRPQMGETPRGGGAHGAGMPSP